MKKILILTLFIGYASTQAQYKIEIKNNKLVRNQMEYKWSQAKVIMKNEEALNYVSKAKSNRTMGNIIASIGGFGIGYGLARVIAEPKEREVALYGPYYSSYATVKTDVSKYWQVAGISAAISLISIPFYVGAKKNIEKAAKIENGENFAEFKPYFDVKSTGMGLAMSYNF